jgi:carboxypeptidase Q
VRLRARTKAGLAAAGLAIIFGLPLAPGSVDAQTSWTDAYKPVTAKIIEAALADSEAWNRLATFTDLYPGRLSGSKTLNDAIHYAAEKLEKDGFQNVHLEKAMVPHWVRGAESAELVSPTAQPIVIAGLGGSVATGPDGVQADAIVVHDFDDLEAHAAQVKGKIVVYNYVYRADGDPLVAYRQGTAYRGAGASRAAKYGAVAALVRSVGPIAHRTPHTGAMRYSNDAPQIPVASLTGEDADKLQRMQDRGDKIVIHLKMSAQTLPDEESANVIAEIRGREKPDEVVVIGGHIDSWDIAPGAMDDGGGIFATWEALRILKSLNLVPRRTIRLVLFTNEENGTRGAQAYRDAHLDQLGNHIMALESDNGVLPLSGINLSGGDQAHQIMSQVVTLLSPLGADHLGDKFDGADVGVVGKAGNVPVMSLAVDMHRYFYIHHTPADTVDKIDPVEFEHCIAAVAIVAYVTADMQQTLEKVKAPAAAGGNGF